MIRISQSPVSVVVCMAILMSDAPAPAADAPTPPARDVLELPGKAGTDIAVVPGRYVRVEAPASSRMAVHEIEVWSAGANIALKNKDLRFTGTGYKGRDINFRNEARALVDGVADFSQRGLSLGTADGVNPWMEMDLGGQRPLERIVFTQPPAPAYDDRAIRLVTVLDADRRVVWTAHFDLRRAPFDKGVAAFDLKADKGRLIGRTVPPNTAQWAPLGDVLEVTPSPAPPDARDRAAQFAARNSAPSIQRLAQEFFARVDLTKPDLKPVREQFERREFAAALDAYRDHFLGKVQRIVFLPEHAQVQTPYQAAADDLLRNIAVVFARHDAAALSFTPGVIDWAAVAADDKSALDLARACAMAGSLQRPLLTAYRETGRAQYLAKWAAITDDWGMNIRADLNRSKEDLRFYFVKDPLQSLNHLCDELAQTARQQPALARDLSGATLARLLIPVLEEYPPAYWWPCRRATFNHTYNALNAATVTSRVLDDFFAGQRLDRENRQHWARIWTMNVTRDGSMNEIGDEGHMDMHWRMGVFVNQMRKTPPPWFTPDFEAEFETGWRQTTLYPIRHLAPDGRGHRFGRRDVFDRIWQLTDRTCAIGGMIPRQTLDSSAILRDPEVGGILQSVFGAGRDRAALPPDRQQIWDKVTAYYGKTFTPPSTASDWMPYAGLHYLRHSWKPDATFIAMICQPKDHPSTNGSVWNTEFHLFDYGQPLLACGAVWVDGQPPFNEAGTLTYKPGSKTETLATASPRPIDARWHTSPLFDYAESFFEGTYQRHGVDSKANKLALVDPPVTGARAQRRIILVRPARLVIVTDAVRVPESAKPRIYEIRQRFALPESADKGAKLRGKVEGDAATLTLINENAPGVTVRRFSAARLAWNPRNTPDSWERGAAMANHMGPMEQLGGLLRAQAAGNLLISALIEPHRAPSQTSVKSTRDRTADGVTGFSAVLDDGAALTWLATLGEARPLRADTIEVNGEGLLVWQRGGQTSGLALGARSMRIGGKDVPMPTGDFEFTLRDGALAETTPIHRPIEPVTFSPAETVFIDRAQVHLSSATSGVEIRYTLDGREPNLTSPLYTSPLTIAKDAFIRARAFRAGTKAIPFTAAGTQATVISDARYQKRDPRPALAAPAKTDPGLDWELVEGNWRSLFSHLHLPRVMPAKSRGQTARLLDVSMRQGDGAFGVRYEGLIDVPADGVWSFHAPAEFTGASCEPGYDLRLWIDGEEWDLGQRFHGRGQWSIALSKGLHRLAVTFADARHRDRAVPESGLWRGYPAPWVVWKGEAPVIEVSGPGIPQQPIPAGWLRRVHTPR